MIGRHAKDPERLRTPEAAEHGRQRGADALCAGGQLSAPHRWEDGAAAGIVPGEGHQEQRHVLEMIGKVLCRGLHPEQRGARRIIQRCPGQVEPLAVPGSPQLRYAFPVQRTELGLDRRVVDQDEPPVLRVAAARCPDRGVQHARLYLGWYRVGAYPPHSPGCVERLVNVQSALLTGC
jgi:hypothetical protein